MNGLLQMRIDGEPAPDLEILGNLGLGHRRRLRYHDGPDRPLAGMAVGASRTSETGYGENRDTLLDPATEEFLRYFTPAPGDGRTFSDDVEIDGNQFKEGERLWISWAMANRDPSVFADPDSVVTRP